MTDPFSISAGVVGVVSLGITVCQGFISYYGPWKSYDDEIQNFTVNLDGLLDIFKLLEEFVSDQHGLQLSSPQHQQIVLTHLTTCKKACHRLEEVLKKCKSSKTPQHASTNDWTRLKRAIYPFKKETLAAALQTVAGLQVNLGLIVQLLNGALIGRQHKQIEDLICQTSSLDVRASRILNLVEQGNISMQTAISQWGMMQPIPAPSMIRTVCSQQQIINTCWRRPRQLPNSSIDLIAMYCTCRQKPRYSSQGLSFSAFALHEKFCPLYVKSQKVLGAAAKYTFCTRFLGLSIYLMFTMSRGAGGFAISPTIQLQAVVSDDSPQFKLLSDMASRLRRAKREGQHIVLQETMNSVLVIFHEKTASPTDRLGDGSTFLHKLADAFRMPDTFALDAASLTILREFIRVLIKAGVPTGEPTTNGYMPLDYLMRNFSGCISTWDIGTLEAILGVMREFLGSGTLSKLLRTMRFSNLEEQRGAFAGYRYFMRHQRIQTMIQLMLRYADEVPEISETDIAILTRSEDGVRRYLSLSSFQSSPNNSPVADVNLDLSMCFGWPRGISLMLESRLQQLSRSLGHHFVGACMVREIESAMVLLKSLDMIEPEHVNAAIYTNNDQILQAIISEIAMRRQQLQQLALDRLPCAANIRLRLPKGSLLDRQAFKVYECLKAHNIKVDSRLSPFRSSVYEVIHIDTNAADLFCKAGFTDLNQCAEDGHLLNIALEGCIPLGATSFINLLRFSEWMTARGVSMYELSSKGYPALHLLAHSLGLALSLSDFTDDMSRSKRQLGRHGIFKRQSLQSLDVNGAQFLSTLLTDSTQDDCCCACSDGGCVPLTRILRSSYVFRAGMTDSITPSAVEALYSTISPYITKRDMDVFVTRIIRCLTFAELGITHTCLSCYPRKKTQLPQDVEEIREEESILLNQLETLVVEFNDKFRELQLGLEEFLEGYWRARMNETRSPNDTDPENVRRARGIGVFLHNTEAESDTADNLLMKPRKELSGVLGSSIAALSRFDPDAKADYQKLWTKMVTLGERRGQ